MEFEALLQKVRSESCDVAVDSRQVKAGDVFVAVPGIQADGAQYIPAAVTAGASVIVCRDACAESRAAAEAGVLVVLHADPRESVWQLAEARYQTMSGGVRETGGTGATSAMSMKKPMRIIGITGTNGKTTCAYLLEHLFTAIGYKVGVLGTVNYRWPGHVEEAPLTTPDALRVHAMLAAMRADGVDVVVMEVSSHALEQHRVGGVPFDGAVFTNLTQDHLDFHTGMVSYFAAKAKLFTELPLADKVCAVNADDMWGRALLPRCPSALSYGLKPSAQGRHLHGTLRSMSTAGLHMEMTLAGQRWELLSPLVGAFNASNLLAVQAVALEMGVQPAQMRHLQDFYGVCGRLERVRNAQGLDIFVDYAHTPDALVNVLQALRGAGFARIITVFGCGGNRDRTKRPRMGQAVAQWSDVAVLTSDNPRHEDPQGIIDDVLPGLKEECTNDQDRAVEIHVEVDRRLATQLALQLMQRGDAVLIAGKGHEDYQILGAVKYPYSDQQTVRELLQCE